MSFQLDTTYYVACDVDGHFLEKCRRDLESEVGYVLCLNRDPLHASDCWRCHASECFNLVLAVLEHSIVLQVEFPPLSAN